MAWHPKTERPASLLSILLASASALPLLMATGRDAAAANDCGPAMPFDSINCTFAVMGQSFNDADGITYAVSDLTISINSNQFIQHVSSGGNGNFGSLTIYGFSGQFNQTTAISGGTAKAGLYARSNNGVVSIRYTDANTTQSDGVQGIEAIGTSASASYIFGDITTAGNGAQAISITSTAGSASVMYVFGKLTTSGDNAQAISVTANGGDAMVRSYAYSYGGPGIVTTGLNSHGIDAQATGGAARVYSVSLIDTSGVGAKGIRAVSTDGLTMVSSVSGIQTHGNDADGILASAREDIQISVSNIITTDGLDSDGVSATALAGGDSDIDVRLEDLSTITTKGANARAVYASSNTGSVYVYSAGRIFTNGVGAAGLNSSAIVARNAGALDEAITIRMRGGEIETNGNYAHGIDAIAKTSIATINIDRAGNAPFGIGITTYGNDSDAVKISAHGTNTVNNELAIVTTGDRADGIDARSYDMSGAGLIDIENRATGSIITDGDQSRGIYTLGNAARTYVTAQGAIETKGTNSNAIEARAIGGLSEISITLSGTVKTAGVNSNGVLADGGLAGRQVSGGGTIETLGNNSAGIAISGVGTNIVSFGGSISTSGSSSRGISEVSTGLSSGLILATGPKIETAGDNSTGLYGSGTSGMRIENRSLVITGGISTNGTGIGSHGIEAIVSSGLADVVNRLGGEIITREADSHGILANASVTGSVSIDNSGSVNTFGANANGLVGVSTGGSITITNTDTVRTYGTGASALFVNGVSSKALTNTTNALLYGNANAVELDGAGATLLSNSGTLRATTDSAILNLGGALTAYNTGLIVGFMASAAGNDVFENRAGGTVLLQDRADNAAFSDFGGGTDSFDNQGNGQVLLNETGAGVETATFAGLESFRNAGLLSLADSDVGQASEAGDVVRIEGGFVSAAGFLSLDTVLGGDGSTTDVLQITGNVTVSGGSTAVSITNVGGLGGQTTPGSGILVIEVGTLGGTSALGDFTLAGPVAAGIYMYDLVLDLDGNWYLQSKVTAGAYEMGNASALVAWNGSLDSLDERLGELRPRRYSQQSAELGAADTPQLAIKPEADGEIGGFWLRGFGHDFSIETTHNLNHNAIGTQIGYDVGLLDTMEEGDMLVLGGFAGMQQSKADLTSTGPESIDLEGYSIGLYAAYFNEGLYLEGVGKVDFYDVSHFVELSLATFDYDTAVYGFSLEGGYRFDLGDAFFVEPQAQMSFAHSPSVSGQDSLGTAVEIDDANSLRGRLGMRAGKGFSIADGGVLNSYFEASVLHEFAGDVSSSAASLTSQDSIAGTSYQVGVGVDATYLASNLSVYADVDLLLGDTEGVKGSLGLRFSW